MLSLNTFGKTPAAEHLVRKLNEIQDLYTRKKMTKSISVAIKYTNNNLRDIKSSVERYLMTVKVAANLLRLLREEANTIVVVENSHINNLTRNIIVGNIKRVIREMSTLRKIENATSCLEKANIKCKQVHIDEKRTEYFYNDHNVACLFWDNFETYCHPKIKDDITPELLHSRSEARMKRK